MIPRTTCTARKYYVGDIIPFKLPENQPFDVSKSKRGLPCFNVYNAAAILKLINV